ncbi:MAG: SpoIIE family protein phosphatase [bacterium]|nr:SpoIIE family protein phosphatase [bacterium]
MSKFIKILKKIVIINDNSSIDEEIQRIYLTIQIAAFEICIALICAIICFLIEELRIIFILFLLVVFSILIAIIALKNKKYLAGKIILITAHLAGITAIAAFAPVQMHGAQYFFISMVLAFFIFSKKEQILIYITIFLATAGRVWYAFHTPPDSVDFPAVIQIFFISIPVILIITPIFFFYYKNEKYKEKISHMNEELQAANEEYEAINENLNAANEELAGMNKNLNQTNEDLEMANDYMVMQKSEIEAINTELVKTRDLLWGEMQTAKKIQTALLPKAPIVPGYDIAVFMEPAKEVGGDYYDIINVGGVDWIIIGDVSGHGIPAGLVMMMVQTSIHMALAHNPKHTPAELLKIINDTISDKIHKIDTDCYMTITVFACHSNDGWFAFSGSHQDILIYRASQKTIETLETWGIWIGISLDMSNFIKDHGLQLLEGDIMLLYTDGITEAWRKGTIKDQRDAEVDMYGENRLKDSFLKAARKSPNEIRENILNDLHDYDIHDDVTIVIIKRL